MFQVILTVGALLLSTFLLLMGGGLLGTLLGIRAVIAEFPTAVTGMVMAAYYVGLILGSIYCRPVVRRVGHIRAFAAFVSIISITPLLHGLWVDPVFWGAIRIVYGFAFAGVYTVIESWLNSRAPDHLRGQVFSVYMIITFAAGGISQFMLAFYEPEMFELLALVAVLFSAAVIPVALTRSTAPMIQKSGALSLRALYRQSPLGLVGSFVAGLALGAIYSMTAVFGQGIGLDVPAIALLVACFIAGGLVLQWPIGRLSDLIDRRQVMTASALIGALVAIVPFLMPEMPRWALYTITGIFGGFSFALYPLAVAHANDWASDQGLLEVSAGLVLVFAAGAAAGPIIAAVLMSSLGDWSLFLYLSATLGVLALFGLYRMTRRPAVPREEQAPYVVVPRTTSEVLHLHPQLEEEPADEAAAEPAG